MRMAGLFLAAFCVAAPFAARGQGLDPQTMEACRRGPADARLTACGKILAAKPAPTKEALASAHSAMCEAYRFVAAPDRFDKAVAACGEAIKIEPANWWHYWVRGFAQEGRQDFEAALADFTSAQKLGVAARDFNAPGVFYHRASNLFKTRHFDDAVAEFTRYFASSRPNDVNRREGCNQRGLSYRATGKIDEAIADFDASLALEDGPIVRFNRSLTWVLKKDDVKAQADFEAVLRFTPNSIAAQYQIGAIRARAGDNAEAVRRFEAVLGAAPKHIEALAGIAEAKRQLALAPKPTAAAPAAPVASSTPAAVDRAASPAAAAAAAEKRVALVIGNSAYKFANPLPNPANDSTDVAKSLRDVGFTVVEGHDLDWRGMVAKAREFSAQLDGAALALVFYAGHGVQVDGHNYLVPVDAKLERAGDLDLDAVDLQTLLRPMEAEKRVNLIFLDACRDNPFTRSLSRSLGSTRSASVARGLAQVNSAAGTMIAFSTQPDNVAQDGEGRNSPFTAALLKYVKRPGLEVEQMMKLVRVDVMAATKEKQVPWGHSSLVGEVFLNPAPN